MKPKDFSRGNTSWEHFCNRLGAGSLSHWSLLRTIFGLKGRTQVFIRPCLLARLDIFAAYTVNIEILRGVSWEVGWGWVCKIESLVVCSQDGLAHSLWVKNLGTLVQDGLAHMRGVTWRAVPAKFKTGMCEMKILRVWGFVVCLWNVGSGWVGTHAWCNMESCSGKVQNRDVWDENFRIWSFVVCLWNVGSGWVGSHAWCNMESCSGKVQNRDVWDENLRVWGFVGIFERFVGTHAWCNMESCSGKVQKRDVWDENLGVWGFVVCLWNVGSGWVGTHAWCNMGELLRQSSKQGCVRWKSWGLRFCGVSLERWFRVGTHAWCNLFRVVPAKFKTGMRWKFSDLKFVVCLGTLVQDGLAHMRGVTWRAVPAKFKTDVWDENLTVWGFVVYLWEGRFRMGWHKCVV